MRLYAPGTIENLGHKPPFHRRPVANSRSARKAIRSSERKHLRNRAVRSSVRTHVGKARQALLGTGGEVDVEAALKAAVKALDRAAEKGILHRNNANRRKSRLTAMAARIMRAAGDDQTAVRSAAAGGQKGTGAKSKTVGAKKPASKAKATTAKATTAKAPTAKAAVAKAPVAKKAPAKAPATPKA